MTSRLSFIAASVLVVFFAACSSAPPAPAVSVGADGKVQNANQLLGQLSLPAGARLLADQSLIIGSGDNWVGRCLMWAAIRMRLMASSWRRIRLRVGRWSRLCEVNPVCWC